MQNSSFQTDRMIWRLDLSAKVGRTGQVLQTDDQFLFAILKPDAESLWFYAFSTASSSSTVAAVVKLSTPKTNSMSAEPGSKPP